MRQDRGSGTRVLEYMQDSSEDVQNRFTHTYADDMRDGVRNESEELKYYSLLVHYSYQMYVGTS